MRQAAAEPAGRCRRPAGSVAFVYRSVNGLLAVETLVFDETGKVCRAYCHYSPS